VILKNFRSKYQGETEGNLEKVLNLLKAMTPVAVMIDEADAYLGQRNSEGDSGVSSRVFSMIASFMSNTDHRGKIIWFLVTARPDLMPVDFKRQGRAEEHIALFYPENVAEKRELFEVTLRKTGLKDFDISTLDDNFFETMTVNSGAEMEAALTRAKFRAAHLGVDTVTAEIIKDALADFLPPTYPAEIELMNYAAVLECTSKALLPEKYKNMSRQAVVERVQELKAQVEMNL
jgi:SpoVK/Ycf46/Vps4 family AAA+-type ATPase